MPMPRYREWLIYPSVDLAARLETLARREYGPQADAKQWVLTMLERVATAMEQEVAKEAAKKNLVQLIDAGGRPQVTVAPLVVPEAR